METLLIVLSVMAVVLAVLVFSPVIILFDSRNRQVRVRWLSALEFQTRLPGAAGQKHLTIFGMPIPIRERPPGAEVTGVKKRKPVKDVGLRTKRQSMGRFFMRCLGDSDVRRVLIRRLTLLLKRIFHSVNLAQSEVDISLPDPAFNGMLAGVLASTSGASPSRMRVNFRSENSLFLELRFHPHRVLKAFLFFLAGLPHRALFRQWRSFAADQRH